MRTDKEFEDFFRDRLDGLEETPPPMAWGKIKQEIKPTRTYYRTIAAVILLFLASTGIFVGVKYQPERTGTAEIPAEEAAVNSTPLLQAGTALNHAAANSAEDRAGSIATGQNPAQSNNQPAEDFRNTSAAQEPIAEITIASNAGTSRKIVPGSASLAFVKPAKKPAGKHLSNGSEKQNAEVPAAQSTRKAPNAIALVPAKRYGSEVRNSREKAAAKPAPAATKTKGSSPAKIATGATLSGNSVVAQSQLALTKTNAETAGNPVIKDQEIALAVAPTGGGRTDSIALPTLPPVLGDSVPEISKAVADRKKTKKDRAKLAITVNFAPGVIARRLVANPNDDTYLRFTEGSQANKKTDLGFDLNATLHHRVSPKTTVDAGFAFTKLHSNVTYEKTNGHLNVVSSPNGANSSSVKVAYAFTDETARNAFSYGGFRLGVTQDLVQGAGNTIFVSGGAGLNMLVGKSGRIFTEPASGTGSPQETSLESNAYHTVNSHLYLSGGLAKEIMPRVRLQVAPAFTYYLNSALRKQHIFELKPYTLGLNFGMRYQF